MSELIDREALKDAVKRYAGEPIKEKDRKCQAICLDMLGTIDAQPAASPWHRVELEEPTKAGWYLVMDVDGDFNVDEWHNTFGWQFVTPSDADRITHWMPLPEPPKEDA